MTYYPRGPVTNMAQSRSHDLLPKGACNKHGTVTVTWPVTQGGL